MSAISVEHVSIRFGGLVALSDVSFDVPPGEIFALIGPNGAGKTTLFNVVSGVYACTDGRIRFNGKTITGALPHELARKGLTRTFQNLQIFFRMSAAENVMVGRHLHERRNPLLDFLGLPMVHRQNAESRKLAEELLDLVGLSGLGDQPAGELPYGVLKRLEIARALATRPSVIMLDEPVAGCNAVETAEIAHVIRKIAGSGMTVMLVEHDMGFVMTLADRIHVLNRGMTLAEGTPSEIRNNPAVIEAYLGTAKPGETSRAHG
ncbi:ABC transporter ATP-binding protein [Chelatococcus reniformis]|uniref:ABC transporter ATP-binding protein n=1 Tax=Chelatococcus reniformis TaxID=1494448 RepID=A0A916XNC4_9HYPH|nr:ABC transporter ATP-binding protein [Chelatococcus reniformis]GGC86969.1 ABC transporter ATP-binding protein [Chelatococcus reniformis]